jgi:hypothetical protein
MEKGTMEKGTGKVEKGTWKRGQIYLKGESGCHRSDG